MGAKPPLSPLAPAGFPELPEIAGVSFATTAAGVRYKDRTDVMLASLAPGTAVAGVFTRSATRSAAVLDCQDKIGGAPEGGAAILVNSGNANAFTGRRGAEAVDAVTAAVAETLGISAARVFSSSTGVIGEPLRHDRITACLDDLKSALSPHAIETAARAIMTTDTFPKGSGTTITVDEQTVHIAGIAKGSGMIAPDMATMLVYIFTDAAIEQDILQDMVSALNRTTFNCITVDGDTSTSDSLMVFATGAVGGPQITSLDDPDLAGFAAALKSVLKDLALQIVRDGEGATKLIEITVTGAKSDKAAKTIAASIANSPLVKTALAASDANWGRIVMAVGKAGEAIDPDSLSIRFGDVEVARKGMRAPDYSEEAASAECARQEISILVDVGVGEGKATVWTCDLTHAYVDINGAYRT